MIHTQVKKSTGLNWPKRAKNNELDTFCNNKCELNKSGKCVDGIWFRTTAPGVYCPFVR